MFDLDEDAGEERDLIDTARAIEAADRLRAALDDVEAPDDQLIRLGLK